MKTFRFFLPQILLGILAALILNGCTPEAKKSRVLDRADRYFKSGEYDKAKIEYLNLLRLDPQNATAFQQMGTIWLEEGAPLRAGGFLIRARELAPNNLDNRQRLARAFISVGQFTEATKEALAILQQSPANGEAILILAEAARTPEDIDLAARELLKFPQHDDVSFQLASANLALRKGDLASAENALQRALALDPKSSSAHLSMAIFHLFKKNPTQAGQELKTAADLAPVRSTERLKYAEFKAQNGAADEATAFLENITNKTPDYLPAWCLLAQIALSEKKYDESLALLENVLTRDAENIDARRVQAEVWLAKREVKKAVEVLERLDKTYSNVPVIKYQLARAYLLNNNPAQAAAALNQVVAANPDYVDAILLLGEINLRAGNGQSVVTAMLDLLKKRPGLRQGQLLLVNAYRSVGRLENAAAVLREQIKVSPDVPEPYLLLGLVLRQQKKTDEARKAFEKASELAPNNLLPIDQLVELDISDKNFTAAMEKVQQQLQKTPNSAGLHFIKGKIYATQGKWDLAESTLSKTLELDANFLRAYDLLISTYVAANKLPEAIGQLKAVLSKNPANTRALMVSALIYEKMNDFSQARDAYEKLLSITPDFVPALNNLAYLYAEKLNQPDKAYDLAQKARVLQPGDASIADTLGWVLYKRADYEQALTLLQESAGKQPDSAEIQFHLGMAGYMMGQTEMARAAFQKAANAPADFPGKEEVQRRLALLKNSGSKELSIADLEGLLKQQPNDPVAWMRLGEAHEKQEAFPKAAEAYEQALKQNPKLLTATVKVAQLNAGPLRNKDKAFEFAKKARELAHDDPQVAGILGNIAYQTGNFTWAYSLLQESARQLTNNAAILRDYAWAAYSLGKVTDARQIMQRVLEATPDTQQTQDAKSFLAMTALDQRPTDLAAAEPEVQKLLKADVNYVPALMVQAAIQAQRADLKSPATTYSEVLRHFPDFAPAQKRLAALYLEDPDKIAQAYDLAVKARKTLTDDPELTEILAEISYQKKEYARALQLLQESARTRPLDATGLYYLGMSHLQAKQEPEGREALGRALAAGLQQPLAGEAKRALADLEGH